MKTHTRSDFWNADLSITKIDRIYSYVSPSWNRPVKQARAFEGLLWFSSGTIEYWFEGFSFTATAGQIVRLPAGIPYNGIKLDTVPLDYHCIDFLCGKLGQYNDYPLPYAFTPTDGRAIESEFSELVKCYNDVGIASPLECRSRLSSLILNLTRDYAKTVCKTYENPANRLREYIVANAARRDFKVSELSEHFHLSQTHIRRVFTTQLGISPQSCLASIRLEKAKQLLISQLELPIAQVAEQSGYSSQYYFSSAFTETVGMSPKKYRELARV